MDEPTGTSQPGGAAPLSGRRDRFRGALLGFAVGDALGAPAEFLSPQQVAERWGVLTEMVGGGCHGVAPGEVTDDTDMMLCLAESLVSTRTFDPDDIVRRYVAWFDSDPNDVGVTVRTVLLSIRSGTPWDRASRRAHEVLGRMTAGNGSLMRSPAIALRYAADPVQRRDAALRESALTHFDRLAGWACVAYTDLVATAIAGTPASLRAALPAIAAAVEPDEPRVAGVLRDALEAEREEIVASGYVLETLKAAVWAVMRNDDLEATIVEAVNLGDDADTVGAVAGALAGALYGEAAIPSRWTAALTVTERVRDAAEGLAGLCEAGQPLGRARETEDNGSARR